MGRGKVLRGKVLEGLLVEGGGPRLSLLSKRVLTLMELEA